MAPNQSFCCFQIWVYQDAAAHGAKWAFEQDYKPFAHRAAKRVGSIHVVLNTLTPENGGDIVFPHTMSEFQLTERNNHPYLEDICRGAVLKPVRFNDFSTRGNALMAYTMLENERINGEGEADSRSEYLHCPVRGADKWILTFSWYHKPTQMFNPHQTPLHQAFTEYDPVANKLSEEFFHHIRPDDLIHVVDNTDPNGWHEGIINGVRKFFPGNHALPVFDLSKAEEHNHVYKKLAKERPEGEIRDPVEYKNMEERARAAHLKEVETFFAKAKVAEEEAALRHAADTAAAAAEAKKSEQKDEL